MGVRRGRAPPPPFVRAPAAKVLSSLAGYPPAALLVPPSPEPPHLRPQQRNEAGNIRGQRPRAREVLLLSTGSRKQCQGDVLEGKLCDWFRARAGEPRLPRLPGFFPFLGFPGKP